jgi:ABC-type uncharacterized transport system permease subunit
MNLDAGVLILVTVIGAATPLLLAALGELVVERSGVLNLGVEGMMLAGAVTAFATAITTGSSGLGVVTGALAGAALALIFAVLTMSLLANQVATGLALTIFGIGRPAAVPPRFPGLLRAVHDRGGRLVPDAHPSRHDRARDRRIP